MKPCRSCTHQQGPKQKSATNLGLFRCRFSGFSGFTFGFSGAGFSPDEFESVVSPAPSIPGNPASPTSGKSSEPENSASSGSYQSGSAALSWADQGACGNGKPLGHLQAWVLLLNQPQEILRKTPGFGGGGGFSNFLSNFPLLASMGFVQELVQLSHEDSFHRPGLCSKGMLESSWILQDGGEVLSPGFWR